MSIWRCVDGKFVVLLRHIGFIPWLLMLPAASAALPEPGDPGQLVRQSEMIPAMIEDKVLARSQIPNPHWQKDTCQACHTTRPEVGRPVLKAQNDNTCLFCHDQQRHRQVHPVSLRVDKKMLAEMDSDYRIHLDKDNRTNCITCHDVRLQCDKQTPAMRIRNRPFLRGGYYRARSDSCYRCHNRDAYSKLNAHDQISDGGKLDKDSCLICHRQFPDHSASASAPQLQTQSGWAEICLNCHRWLPHPGGNMAMFSGGKPPDHLVVPSQGIRDRLDKMTRQTNVDMPLETATGKIYCATCHNPHERGVISNVALARGADEENRLRSKRICINCHEK